MAGVIAIIAIIGGIWLSANWGKLFVHGVKKDGTLKTNDEIENEANDHHLKIGVAGTLLSVAFFIAILFYILISIFKPDMRGY